MTQLSIEKLIYGGDGLARTAAGEDGRSMAVFVPFVLPGEKIEAELGPGKAGFARATIGSVLAASPDRVTAACPYYQQCGGCHYQHIPYRNQIAFKAGILRETLQRIARIDLQSEIRLHESPAWNYRNRTRLQVRTAPRFALGYFRFSAHEFLPVHQCPINSPLLNRALARLLEVGGADCPPTIEELELFADAGDEHLLAWAFCGREAAESDLLRWAEALRRELPEVSGLSFFASRLRRGTQSRDNGGDDDYGGGLHPRLLARSGAGSMEYRVGRHGYRVSAGSFFQANRFLIDELISSVVGNAAGEFALDLYAGVGLFSLPLAEKFRHIFGVEASQTAYDDFVHNVLASGVSASVKAVAARTEDYLGSGSLKNRRSRPDLVVLDPPRAGAGKAVIRSLVELGAPRVRYVSCDPSTMARDIVPLIAAGYRVEEAHLFDLFPETFHIETVLLLAR